MLLSYQRARSKEIKSMRKITTITFCICGAGHSCCCAYPSYSKTLWKGFELAAAGTFVGATPKELHVSLHQHASLSCVFNGSFQTWMKPGL